MHKRFASIKRESDKKKRRILWISFVCKYLLEDGSTAHEKVHTRNIIELRIDVPHKLLILPFNEILLKAFLKT